MIAGTNRTPSPPSERGARRSVRGGLWMAALSLTVLYPSAGHSAEAPATRPGSPTTRSFQESLKLTEKEQRALSAVRDRSTQRDETAFYMLLRKAHRISEIGEQKLRALDRPAVENLLRHPERYRGWAIRIPLRVHRVEKLTVLAGTIRIVDKGMLSKLKILRSLNISFYP